MCFSSFRRIESAYWIFLCIGRKHRKKKVFVFLKWFWCWLQTSSYFISSLGPVDFLWLLHCTPKLLSGAPGFPEDISHPTWRMNCDRSVFWKDHSSHQSLGAVRLTVQAQFTISTGVWNRQTRSEARTVATMKRMWSLCRVLKQWMCLSTWQGTPLVGRSQ